MTPTAIASASRQAPRPMPTPTKPTASSGLLDHKLTNIAGPTAASYSLDPSGNVTATGGKTYAYDARGRLANITVGTVNSYGINGLGQRVTKAGTGYTGTIRYVYAEDGKLLGEYDNTGTIIAEHVYLNDTPVAVLKTAGAYLGKRTTDPRRGA